MRKPSVFIQPQKILLAGTSAAISPVMTLSKHLATLLTALKSVSVIHYVLTLYLDMLVQQTLAI